MSGNRITRSLSSEWRKVLSTKLWWILAIVIAAYSAMIASMFGFMFSAMGEALAGAGEGAPALPAQSAADMVYSSVSGFGYVVPLLLGALTATGELRHRTLGLTFTLEPRRGLVLLSKTVVLLGFGIALGAAGLIGAVGAGASVLAATGADPMLGTGETWAVIGRVLAVLGIWAVIGFGIGVLVRNQAVAIVIALVFTQFVEPLLRTGAQFWEWSAQVAKFLPGAATDAFVGASLMNNLSALDPSAPQGSGALGIWAGFAVIVAYAAVALAAGWLLRWRRDVV
ncbi:ABC transporter permease [Leucobacter tenebrionis]|uniref:ABC transporter permease n=1 Tax=Leucobacter tenebrionis TaxID=2873270 RepID=UPI001CA70985|nr:ABC transporter permease [Leucobacter tenebrionis]QZY51096.1 ABC transporter permease [Leucobacter tenebrionis]